LFSKFASKSYQGTGLGLFICKSIIEAHGGKIWAENNSNGKGATFAFNLPIN
jgi:signal transduction histidine kinase